MKTFPNSSCDLEGHENEKNGDFKPIVDLWLPDQPIP